MSTNVATIVTLQGIWKREKINAEALTAAISNFSPFLILWYPDTSESIIIENEKLEETEKLRNIFAEFAQEDVELAELGIGDYSQLLMAEDMA